MSRHLLGLRELSAAQIQQLLDSSQAYANGEGHSIFSSTRRLGLQPFPLGPPTRLASFSTGL